MVLILRIYSIQICGMFVQIDIMVESLKRIILDASTEKLKLPMILPVEQNDNQLVISIRDYGVGIPKKVRDKLFKEMITTKGKNGTGLGLYMSYSTIRAHFNGSMNVESEEGKGSTFSIVLPV